MQADIVFFFPAAVIFQGLILLYRLFCQNKEFPSFLRGDDAAGAARENRKPDFLFQLPDVTA